MRPLAAPVLAVLILFCSACERPTGDEGPLTSTSGSPDSASAQDIQDLVDAAVDATVDAIAVRATLEAEPPLPTLEAPASVPVLGRGSSETAPLSGAEPPTVGPGPTAPALPSPTPGRRAEVPPTPPSGGGSTETPTLVPTAVPTETPAEVATPVPAEPATVVPTAVPTETPTAVPTAVPTEMPTAVPTPVPTEAPTVVPTPLPTATRSPTPTPTVPPPDPSPELFLDMVALTSPVTRGSEATLEARTLSGARCSLRVTLPSGSVSASGGTGAQPVAGGDGVVSWTWRVGGGTTPGVGKVRVECRLGGDRVEATRDLVIRARS